jgi:tellurite resistance protein TehA-like permease
MNTTTTAAANTMMATKTTLEEGEAHCKNHTPIINLARIVGLTKFDCATALAYDISSLFIVLFAVFLLFYLVYENTRADQMNRDNTCSRLKFSEIALMFVVVVGSAFGGFITVAVVAFLCFVYGFLYMMMMMVRNNNNNDNNNNSASGK